TVPDHVERFVLEYREILHVAADEADLDPLPFGQVADGFQLGRRDVEDRRVRAEFGEDNRIPTTARRQAEDAGALQLHAFQTCTRIHEAPYAALVLGGRPKG